MVKEVKKRKPRGIKLSGYPSYDLCKCCYSYDCNPMSMSEKFDEKVRRRIKSGLCVACGKSKCICKSKS